MSEFGLYGPITSSEMTFSRPQKEPNSLQNRQKEPNSLQNCQNEHALLGGPNETPAKVKKISEDMHALRNGLSFYFSKLDFS